MASRLLFWTFLSSITCPGGLNLDALHQTSERQAREKPNLGVSAAVDSQALTVDEGLFRIGEERNCGGDFLDLAVTSNAGELLEHVSPRAICRAEFGVNRAGLDVIDCDTEGAQLAGPAARE